MYIFTILILYKLWIIFFDFGEISREMFFETWILVTFRALYPQNKEFFLYSFLKKTILAVIGLHIIYDIYRMAHIKIYYCKNGTREDL